MNFRKIAKLLFNRSDSSKEKTPDNIVNLKKFQSYVSGLDTIDHYVSRQEYIPEINQYADTINFFRALEEDNILGEYCGKYNFDYGTAIGLISQYGNIENLIKRANEEFISRKLIEEKEYLDGILKDIDPVIQLDDEQRQVVLSDEDYSLVIAGAGAGKTTTIAAKVKYLVERKGVDADKILVISFTNKAVNELREKINKNLNIACPIATFHSTGNAILHKNNPDKMNIVESSKLYYVILNYFKGNILNNKSVVDGLVLFFSSYFNAPFEGDDINDFLQFMSGANYSTMKSELDEFKQDIIDSRSKKKVTIQNEIVRSVQEVKIANFLYLNSIDYQYEPIYKYNISMARKLYTPDFLIREDGREAYIEHFGITEDGKNSLYSEDELKAYMTAVNDKIRLHKAHGTELIYTFSQYKDGRSIEEHLQEQLIEHSFTLSRRSNNEIIKKLASSDENKYIGSFVYLVTNFIRNFKINGYDEDDFDKLAMKTDNVRTKLFLDIAHACYLEYKQFLVENSAVDFEDMINESARVLREVKDMKQKLDFEYLIVDEYQDISRQRFDLVRALSDVTDAKIMAVGDDWQSIYAFSGSDITLFTKFEEKMGYAKLMKITRTYRNSQEIIDIAGNFIQKNSTQIKKSLVSPKHIDEPVIIYTYDGKKKYNPNDRRSGQYYALAYAVVTAIEKIIEFDKASHVDTSGTKILLLGRFNFDGDRLARTGMFEYRRKGSKLICVKYPKLDITFMTAHASKGLGYDNVIVVNGRNERYGFPSKIEDDPILSLVVREDRSIQYAEERRLFYVAMTRTKNRVYFVAPEQNPSEFLLEIKKEYKNVYLNGTWNETPPQNLEKKTCPICGYPLQLKYKLAYGLRLYICTNEPEICSFMTNDIRGGKLSIMKCSDCKDGYLVVKPNKKDGMYFLGCTNYKQNGKGCNKAISAQDYYKLMEYDTEELRKHVNKMFPSVNPSETVLRQTKTASDVSRINWEMQVMNERSDVEVASDKFGQYAGMNIFDVVEMVISCLAKISDKRYFGKTILINTLLGEENSRIVGYKMNELSEFGGLSELSREDIKIIVEWLIDKHYICVVGEKYPVLHITSEGLNYRKELTPEKMRSLLNTLNRK